MRFGDQAPESVPQQRIIQKMDEYMSRRDYDGARRHLLYWLEEAQLIGDKRGELLIRNEMIGHCRKTGDKAGAFENIEEALKLVKELDLEGSISAGTTYVNAATAFNAFGENEASIALFEKARAAYENSPYTDEGLLGGLCNNMALTYAALGRFREASALYEKALEHMKKVPGGELEQAITLLNVAEAVEMEQGTAQGEKEIARLLDQALELLETSSLPRDGYYAFVCEKCAPSFSYYGYFAAAEELEEEAKRIYKENGDREQN